MYLPGHFAALQLGCNIGDLSVNRPDRTFTHATLDISFCPCIGQSQNMEYRFISSPLNRMMKSYLTQCIIVPAVLSYLDLSDISGAGRHENVCTEALAGTVGDLAYLRRKLDAPLSAAIYQRTSARACSVPSLTRGHHRSDISSRIFPALWCFKPAPITPRYAVRGCTRRTLPLRRPCAVRLRS